MVVVSQRRPAFCERGHPVSIQPRHASAASVPGPKRRAGLVFVGAPHPDTPNEDGLVVVCRAGAAWLRWRRAAAGGGGECRSPRIAALASAEVRVLGAQTDLVPLCYDRARSFIAPVRFGRGVPVKVITAAQGIPVVTSAILQRQLGWQDGRHPGLTRCRGLARAIARLLDDDAHWQACAAKPIITPTTLPARCTAAAGRADAGSTHESA